MRSLILLNLLFLFIRSYGQNQDSLFTAAKQLGFKGDFQESHLLLNILIESNPTNIDYLKFKASLYKWTRQYDSSITMLNINPRLKKDIESLNMQIWMYMQSKEYEKMFALLEKAKQLSPANKETRELELDALFATKQFEACYHHAVKLKHISFKAKSLSYIVANKIYSDRIGVGTLTTLQSSNLTNRYSISYQHRIRSFNSISHVNAIQKLNDASLQFQEELYKTWKGKGYSYGMLSYSSSPFFPKISTALIHFYPILKGKAELDLGVRYFKSNNYSFVPSFGTTYYIGKLSAQYRYYFVLSPLSNGNTHTLCIKKYYNNPDAYLKLDLATGIQVNNYNQSNVEYQLISKGQSISMLFQKPITTRLNGSVQIQFNNTKINETSKMKTYSIGLNLVYKILKLF